MESRKITEFDLDILGEIGNIGSGNAATALSQMLNQTVLLDVPSVKLCNLVNVAECFGGAEVPKTGVFLAINGLLDGYILLLLDIDDVKYITNLVASKYKTIDSDQVLLEVGNIITGAYVGALASMINGKLSLTPPEIAHDMMGALIDSVVSKVLSVADETVVINTKLNVDNKAISCNYVFLLEQDSLNKLLGYFNQEE